MTSLVFTRNTFDGDADADRRDQSSPSRGIRRIATQVLARGRYLEENAVESGCGTLQEAAFPNCAVPGCGVTDGKMDVIEHICKELATRYPPADYVNKSATMPPPRRDGRLG